MAAQVPLPLTLHAWQAGQLELPQQTPSTQFPVLHWLAAVQATPFAFSVQLLVVPLPWQVLGARQSPSEVQGELLHAFVPQTYGEQLLVAGAAQLPAPSQWEIGE